MVQAIVSYRGVVYKPWSQALIRLHDWMFLLLVRSLEEAQPLDNVHSHHR